MGESTTIMLLPVEALVPLFESFMIGTVGSSRLRLPKAKSGYATGAFEYIIEFTESVNLIGTLS